MKAIMQQPKLLPKALIKRPLQELQPYDILIKIAMKHHVFYLIGQ